MNHSKIKINVVLKIAYPKISLQILDANIDMNTINVKAITA